MQWSPYARRSVEELPAQESPELFGLHANADLTFRTLQAQAAVQTVLDGPRPAGSAPPRRVGAEPQGGRRPHLRRSAVQGVQRVGWAVALPQPLTSTSRASRLLAGCFVIGSRRI